MPSLKNFLREDGGDIFFHSIVFILIFTFTTACIELEIQKLLVIFLKILVELGILLRQFREFNEMRLTLV